nr:ribonuclease H-like domain-containing protein [Tanacetum cinerariifolium]
MEDPEQDFVKYASSRTDEARGLVSNFMAFQDARLSKFEANFKQQQSAMTNKIDTVLKAIIDRMVGALPSDTAKNPKLNVNSTSLVLYARFYPTVDPQCSSPPPLQSMLSKHVPGWQAIPRQAICKQGVTRSIFRVKGVDLGEEEAPYWTTLGKRESYKPRPSSDGVGARTPYYARKDFLDFSAPLSRTTTTTSLHRRTPPPPPSVAASFHCRPPPTVDRRHRRAATHSRRCFLFRILCSISLEPLPPPPLSTVDHHHQHHRPPPPLTIGHRLLPLSDAATIVPPPTAAAVFFLCLWFLRFEGLCLVFGVSTRRLGCV